MSDFYSLPFDERQFEAYEAGHDFDSRSDLNYSIPANENQ
jgi:hypothetical protein